MKYTQWFYWAGLPQTEVVEIGTFLESMKRYALVRTLFYLLLGLVMLIFPEIVVQFIVYVFAAYVIILGIMNIVASRKGGGSGGLVSGIVLIVIGICMFIFSRAIASILPIFIGILLVIIGATQLAQSFSSRKFTGHFNVFQLILGLLVLVGGVIGIINPFGSLVFLFRVFGVVLIIMAVNELSLYLSLRKGSKAAQQDHSDNTSA